MISLSDAVRSENGMFEGRCNFFFLEIDDDDEDLALLLPLSGDRMLLNILDKRFLVLGLTKGVLCLRFDGE